MGAVEGLRAQWTLVYRIPRDTLWRLYLMDACHAHLPNNSHWLDTAGDFKGINLLPTFITMYLSCLEGFRRPLCYSIGCVDILENNYVHS